MSEMSIGSLFGTHRASGVGNTSPDVRNDDEHKKDKFPADWFAKAISADGAAFRS